ncbi:nuclear protein MDM1-like isoform X2 [Rhopilema esculentum]|uniref:nuclear protein MDM1-like isoform X2 n=1 Tax=Rhopilema esculentum TaxID=499914 RepID=UPI0031E15055
MPSKFETEYNSSFKGFDNDVSKVVRSPVLKPRASDGPIIAPVPILKKKSGKEAGIKSLDVHITREPPLQHKKAAALTKNADKIIPAPKENYKEIQNPKAFSEGNPILDYAAKRQTAKVDANEQFKDDKFAGRESYNQGYSALEPPMQRKKRSPFNFNHNILRTDTIPPMNGNSKESEGNGLAEVTAVNQNVSETAKRKLEFEQPAKRDVPVESLFPIKTADWRLREDTSKKESSPLKEHADDSKREKRRRKSPAKEQRKKDLDDVKNKQNERVDRALKIKAGMQTIEPPLHSHPIKTEYQLQFAWKEPVRHEIYPKVSVPVEVENAELASDDLTKRKFKPFKSEYQLQFREYPLVKQSPDFSIAGDKKAPADNAGDHKEGKGGKPVVDRRLLHQSKNVQPLFVPYGKSKLVTEYNANFVAPSKFSPGKVSRSKAQEDEQSKQETVETSESLDWFKEVLRLRERAQSYKVRTRETHYPTVFLASLYDDDEDETASEEGVKGSEKANFNLEAIGGGKVKKTEDYEDYVAQSSEEAEEKDEPAETSNTATNVLASQAGGPRSKTNISDSRKHGKSARANGSSKQSTVAATGKVMKTYVRDEKVSDNYEDEEAEAISSCDKEGLVEADVEPLASPVLSSSSSESDSVMSLLKGRIETPRLKSRMDPRRHNLDRTTPLRGGNVAFPGQKLSSEVTAPVHEFRTLEPDIGYVRPKKWAEGAARKTMVGNVAKYGPPGEPEIIRETRPKTAHYHKTYRRDKYEDKANEGDLMVTDLEERDGAVNHLRYEPKDYKQKDKRPEIKYSRKPPRAFVQPSEIGQDLDNTVQSDILSDTSMSARESVISDVLQRSRKRRDNFW